MGQKVNPVGLRVGINRGWDSVWFAKKREYGKLLLEDYKKQCDDTSLVHFDDCGKEQLKRARKKEII